MAHTPAPEPTIDHMWPTGSVHHWRGMGGSSATPIGPAMTTLRSVVAPLASMVRSAGIVYIVVQVVIWHSFYTADCGDWRPRRGGGLGARRSWSACGGAGPPPLWPGWTPPFTWRSRSAREAACHRRSATTCSAGWSSACRASFSSRRGTRPRALSALLALIIPAAYLGRRVAAARHRQKDPGRGGDPPDRRRARARARPPGLYRRAAAAGRGRGRAAEASAGEQYAVLSRNIERREHERLLHDTVLNTLTALARANADDVAEGGEQVPAGRGPDRGRARRPRRSRRPGPGARAAIWPARCGPSSPSCAAEG